MGGTAPATTSPNAQENALTVRLLGPPLRLVVAGTLVLAGVALYACGSGSGGSGSTSVDGGTSAGNDSAPASDDGSSSTSSSGLVGSTSSSGAPNPGGGSSSGGGRVVYTCTGCIDLEGQCSDGGADDKCGMTGGGCVNCKAFHQMCGSGGECVDTSGDAGSGSATPQDSGTD